MGSASTNLKYKHIKMDQGKINKAKKLFHANTDTEAVDRALEFVIGEGKINTALRAAGGQGRIEKILKQSELSGTLNLL